MEYKNINSSVKSIIGEHITSCTRFDINSIHQLGEEVNIKVSVTLTIVQNVILGVHSYEAAKHLNQNGIIKSIHTQNYEEAIKKVYADLQYANKKLPDELKKWANNEKEFGVFRRLLNPNSVNHSTGSFGYEMQCNDCMGNKMLSCKGCGASGKLFCHICTNLGKVKCTNCRGSKKIACYTCRGEGIIEAPASQANNYDTIQNSYSQTYHTVKKPCPSCYGNRGTTCYTCDAFGEINCQNCSGQGYINCLPCNGKGKIACIKCDQSGVVHAIHYVKADGYKTESLSINEENESLRNIIEKNIELSEFIEYGRVLSSNHECNQTGVVSIYEIEVDVIELNATINSQPFTFYGFGKNFKIFDYQNVMACLLEDDLINLEESIKKSNFTTISSGNLLKSIKQFVNSDVNLTIIEKLDYKNKIIENEADDKIKDKSKFSLSSNYILRSNKAFNLALAQIYSEGLVKIIFKKLIFIFIITSFFYAFEFPAKNIIYTIFVLSLMAGIFWFLVEILKFNIISKIFPEKISIRIMNQIRKGDSIRKWRAVAFVATIITISTSIYVFDQIPYLKNFKETRSFREGGVRKLSAWMKSSQQDFQLRDYPLIKYDINQIKNDSDDIVLASVFQHLYGVGIPKDISKAKELIDISYSDSKNAKNSSWKTAIGLHYINENKINEAIKILTLSLKEGSWEAGYWIGRLYLDQKNSIFNIKQGLSILEMVAPYHAHANLLLASIYADGYKGIAKDFKKYRFYRERANKLGLEAQPMDMRGFRTI